MRQMEFFLFLISCSLVHFVDKNILRVLCVALCSLW